MLYRLSYMTITCFWPSTIHSIIGCNLKRKSFMIHEEWSSSSVRNIGLRLVFDDLTSFFRPRDSFELSLQLKKIHATFVHFFFLDSSKKKPSQSPKSKTFSLFNIVSYKEKPVPVIKYPPLETKWNLSGWDDHQGLSSNSLFNW